MGGGKITLQIFELTFLNRSELAVTLLVTFPTYDWGFTMSYPEIQNGGRKTGDKYISIHK